MTRRDPFTLDLFEVPTPMSNASGQMDLRASVSGLVAKVLKDTDQDRYAIAAECSRLSAKDVSKYMLDAYSSEGSDDFNIPLWLVPLLESACKTHELTQWLAEVRGGRLLIGGETLMAELGKLERIKEQANQKIRDIKKTMGKEV